MSNESKKPNYKLMDEHIAKLMLFGVQAAPAYNTAQRLTRACLDFLASHVSSYEELVKLNICSKEMADKICHGRHDHTTLESALMIVDAFLEGKYTKVLRNRLCEKFSDEELLRITIDSKQSTIDYVKKTIPIDVLVGHLEGRAIYLENKSVKDFSKEMLSLLYEIYPIEKKSLAA